MKIKSWLGIKVSNLVGDNTQAKKSFGRGASKRACNMGSAKAPVLPDPVWASPITSFPVEHKGQKITSNLKGFNRHQYCANFPELKMVGNIMVEMGHYWNTIMQSTREKMKTMALILYYQW